MVPPTSPPERATEPPRPEPRHGSEPRLRLSTRLSLGAILLAALLTLVLVGTSVSMRDSFARDLAQQYAGALQSTIRHHLLEEMATDDKQGFNRLLADVAQTDGVHVRVWNRDGTVRFSWRPGEAVPLDAPAQAPGTTPREPAPSSQDDSHTLVAHTTLRAEDGCEQCHEPAGALLGTMEIGIPTTWLAHRATASLDQLAVIGAAALVALLGVALWGFRHQAKRLRKLADTMGLASRGDFSLRVSSDPADEVGRVAGAFNHLLAELGAARRREAEAHRLQVRHMDRLALAGELAVGAAHEVKNPLGAMSAALDSLLRRKEDGEERELLQRVRQKLEDVHGIMTDLLQFARPKEPVLELLDPEDCVDKVLAILDSKLGKQGVTLRRRRTPDVPPVLADERLLGQVFINLILNAMEARPVGLELDLDTGRAGNGAPAPGMAAEGAGIWIRVRDNGPGIPEENLPQVFRPFFSTKPQGSGMGLAICREIVRQHGGELTLERSPSGGVEATVFLPAPPHTETTKPARSTP